MHAMTRSRKQLKNTVKKYHVRALRKLIQPRMTRRDVSRTLGSCTVSDMVLLRVQDRSEVEVGVCREEWN